VAVQAGILTRIVQARRAATARAKRRTPLRELTARAGQAPAPRDFRGALTGVGVALIAECKQRSPSGGLLQASYDPVALAKTYEANGASAISVLTEPDFFGGSLEHLKAVRAAVRLPVLCKDFVVEEYQVVEARAMGADCVLLIVSLLTDRQLGRLEKTARAHGMQALVEVHDAQEVRRALETGATMIGINNRDLKKMKTDPQTTRRLRPLIPPGSAVVSESGIATKQDMRVLAELGVDAALVGEALLRAPDIGAGVRELVGQ
jgi:indole-3-glycerol phosphate synthase